MTTKMAWAAAVTLLLPMAACGGASSDSKGAQAPNGAPAAATADEPPPKLHGPKKRVAIVDFEDVQGTAPCYLPRRRSRANVASSGFATCR